MALTESRKQLGTLPTKRGDRFLSPANLPHVMTANEALRELLGEYLPQVDQYRKDEATVTRLTQAMVDAREQHPQRVYEAHVKGRPEPKDPVPGLEKKLTEAERARDISEYTVVQTSNRLQDMRDDLDLMEHAQGRWDSHLARISDMARTLDWEMDDLGETQYLLLWLKSHKPTRKSWAAPKSLRSVVSWRSTRTPSRRAGCRPLRHAGSCRTGEDVEDIDGNPLTFAEAEDLHKRGKLKINHGKPLPRNAPEFE